MIRAVARQVFAELALHRHNKRNKQGVVDHDAQEFHIVRNVLPEPVFKEALENVASLKHEWVRSETSWRRGSAIGGHELSGRSRGNWLDYLTSDDFLNKVRAATGIEALEYVPLEDTNRLSLLLYQGEDGGDGIDWHVDGSIYLGQRWAGILVLLEDTREVEAKLELAPHGTELSLPKTDIVNSLVLFRGDHIRHRVRPMLAGEERVVLSLLFSDWPRRTMNPFLLRYQSRVNQAFYNNPNP